MSHAPATSGQPPKRPRRSFRRPRFHRAFLGLFLLGFVWLAMATVSDYGPMWDCWEYYIGDKNLAFFMSGDIDYIRKPLVNLDIYQRGDHPDWYALYGALQGNDAVEVPHLIWPLGPTLGALTKRIFWDWLPVFDPIAAQHLINIFLVALMLAVIYRFTRLRLGLWAAVIGILVTATYPRFWAHMQNNVKDVPSAVMFSLVVIVVVEAVRRHAWKQMLAAAVLWGLALATKANAIFVPVVVAPWFILTLWLRYRRRGRIIDGRMIVAIAAVPFIGFAVMLLAWPLLLVDFPHQLMLYLNSLVERGVESGDAAVWTLRPLVDAIVTMPIPVLILLFAGVATMFWDVWRRRRLPPVYLLALTWLIVPVLRVSVPGARDFDVIRHWLEFVPAVAMIAGIGGQRLLRLAFRWLRRRTVATPLWRWRRAVALAAIVLWMLPTMVWSCRNHPYQLVFYNSLIGGLDGARARQMPDANDYWAGSYRQGLAWLAANADLDAWLMVGMAEHIVLAVREIWLRPDLQMKPVTGRPPAILIDDIAQTGATTYIMYAIRPEWYHPIVPALEGNAETVHEIRVDGAVILRILKLTVTREAPPSSR